MRPVIRPGKAERDYPASIELREGDGESGPARLVGHAAVYNRWSQDLGGFKERILPGAFDKSIGVSEVRALFNHDANYIFGGTSVRDGEGSLTLSSDTTGLRIDCEPMDTPTIRDLVLAPIRLGLVNKMSFSFSVRGDELWDQPATAGTGAVWRSPKKDGGLYERDLLDLELFDVSPVVFPAYTQTDIGVRALLATTGIDFDALITSLAHAERGLPLTDNDLDLLRGAVTVLRTYLPADEANGEEPSGANGEEPSHSDQPMGATRAYLLRDLEHRIRAGVPAAY